MPLTGNMSENQDQTKNISITGSKIFDSGDTLSATGFANGVKTGNDPMKPPFNPSLIHGPSYSNAGLNLGAETRAGSVNLTGTHVPDRANLLTASTNVHLINTDAHKLTANAFTTQVMPKVGPSFGTHGGGVDYTYKNTLGANASVSHTPMFKQTDYSVGGSLNLHQTPTSSFGLNLGATRSDNPFSKGSWQPGASFGFKKTF